MVKRKNKNRLTGHIGLAVLGTLGLGLLISILLRNADIALLNPKGLVAQEERNLMFFAVALLLILILPVLAVIYFVAWKYRETNQKIVYSPEARNSKFFAVSMWAIPSIFMLVLALTMFPATHRLEPRKSIASDVKPLTIQVIAMRWKWVFIYPEQNIATVNFVQVPVNTPVQFELTADETPMSSFWIPHLSGQLYAMTGHVTRLNLIADQAGDYPGSSAEINGHGFAGMKFVARASSEAEFAQWVQSTKNNSESLDTKEYTELLVPSENNQPAYYSTVNADLYDKLLMKYNEANHHQPTIHEASGH